MYRRVTLQEQDWTALSRNRVGLLSSRPFLHLISCSKLCLVRIRLDISKITAGEFHGLPEKVVVPP